MSSSYKGGFLRDDTTGALVLSVDSSAIFASPLAALAGDGLTDDTDALAALLATGKNVTAPAGKTFLISSALVMNTAGQVLDLAGSTIKKAATFGAAQGITVSGAGATVLNLTIDGNRTGGALGDGIKLNNVAAVFRNVVAKANKGNGVYQTGASADSKFFGCEANDNVGGTGTATGTSCGWNADGGVLRLYDCVANDNDGLGCYLQPAVGDACHIELRAERNLRSGLGIRNHRGTVARLVARKNLKWGLELGRSSTADTPTDWQVFNVEASDTGAAFANANGAVAQNVSGTAVEGYGVVRLKVGTIHARDNLGYTLALAANSAANGSTARVGSVLSTQTNAADGDPAIHVSGNSKLKVGHALVADHTMAVSFGEGLAGTPDSCVIGFLAAVRCAYAIWRLDAGTNCRIDRVVARDCTTNDSASYPGLFTFKNAGTTGNSVGSFQHITTVTAPNATISQTLSAAGNFIVGSKALSLGSPGGIAEIFDRRIMAGGSGDITTALTAQTVYVFSGRDCIIPAGQSVAGAVLVTGATALAGTAHLWAGLVRMSDRKLLAVTADDTAGAWALHAAHAFTFVAPWVADVDTHVGVCLLVDATTMPTLNGVDWNSNQTAVKTVAPLQSATADTAVTAPLAVGATLAAFTWNRIHGWGYVT